MFDARTNRRNQLRKMVGSARARLNAILKEEAKALRRAARANLREDIRRLEEEEAQRMAEITRRRFGREEDVIGEARDVEMEEAMRRMNQGGDTGVQNGNQGGVHVRSPHPGVGHQGIRLVQDEDGRRYEALVRGNQNDPRIRRMREQDQREQETVEEVRRIREERWNGNNGRRAGGLQQQDRQHGSIQRDQPGPSGHQQSSLQQNGRGNHQLPHQQAGRIQQQRAPQNSQQRQNIQLQHQQNIQLQHQQGARNQVVHPAQEVQCRLPAIR